MSFPTVQNLLRDILAGNIVANNIEVEEDELIKEDLTVLGSTNLGPITNTAITTNTLLVNSAATIFNSFVVITPEFFNIAGEFIVNKIIKLATGLTTPANTTNGVIQFPNKSDATYGAPSSSSILYCDDNNMIKVKNSEGLVIPIRSSYANYYLPATVPWNFSTINTYTELVNPALIGQDSSLDFVLSGGTLQRVRYDPQPFNPPIKVLVTINISLNTTNALGGRYDFVIYKNPLTNASNEIISGTQLANFFTPETFSNNIEFDAITMTGIISLNFLDEFSIFSRCTFATAAMNVHSYNITLNTILA